MRTTGTKTVIKHPIFILRLVVKEIKFTKQKFTLISSA